MNAQHGTGRVMIAALAAFGIGLPAAAPARAGDGDLKWTPHRASTRPVEEVVAAQPAAPRTPPVQPTGPAASVTLPDRVPAVPPRVARREEVYTPPRLTPPARPPLQPETPARKFYDPANPDAIFGFDIMRTPRASAARPILGPEGEQALAMRAAAERAADERLGGGLAPRYVPSGGAATAGRPERLAMNVDGIPSVMTQAPQVGGLDDTGVPGRTPPGAAAGDALPTPADGGPAAPRGPAPADAAPIESIAPGIELPADDGYGPEVYGPEGSIPEGYGAEGGGPGDGLLMGEYPAQLHVESFYDDPYACEDDEWMGQHHGRICTWLRRFGRPYYGWRWYRDFTASAGITAFTNATDLGVHGNFGTNEYLNWSMPFWNAFGVGWQVGWRGTQTNFQPSTVEVGTRMLSKNARDQQFVTTGFFTRAFEGRGLQGGAVYDYLHDSWIENTDVSQLRYELSYVWGYHEIGYWGASNIGDQNSLFGPITRVQGYSSTLDLYTGFYRLQFGDANEWKVWGGGTGEGDGIVGTLVRAPMHKSLALEGTFTYVIPGRDQVIDFDGKGQASTFSPSAWNLAVNVVWYPAGRSRRGLASPYRPLFEVADNGSMIRTVQPLLPTP